MRSPADDLAGWLLEQETGEDAEPERWHIVNMPAIAEEPPAFPPTCTVEPDERAEGEALCPDRYPLRKLKALRRRLGEAARVRALECFAPPVIWRHWIDLYRAESGK